MKKVKGTKRIRKSSLDVGLFLGNVYFKVGQVYVDLAHFQLDR